MSMSSILSLAHTTLPGFDDDQYRGSHNQGHCQEQFGTGGFTVSIWFRAQRLQGAGVLKANRQSTCLTGLPGFGPCVVRMVAAE